MTGMQAVDAFGPRMSCSHVYGMHEGLVRHHCGIIGSRLLCNLVVVTPSKTLLCAEPVNTAGTKHADHVSDIAAN